MLAEEYTQRVKQEAAVIVERLKRLSQMMKEHGDEVRAMDLDEAISYVEASVDD